MRPFFDLENIQGKLVGGVDFSDDRGMDLANLGPGGHRRGLKRIEECE